MNEEQVPRPEPRPPGTADEESWLREVLTSEAGTYSPDADRMREAVRNRIAARPPGRFAASGGGGFRGRWGVRGIRLAGIPAGIVTAGLCAAVAVGLGMTATQGSSTAQRGSAQAGGTVAAATGSQGPESSAHAAVDATSTPLAAGIPDSTPSRLADSPSAPPSSSPAGASPSASASGVGGVVTAVGTQNTAADNSVWSEEDVAITLTAPVTSFQLTVKVSMSPSVSFTGDWTTDNPSQFDITVDPRSDGIYYTWKLKAGQTLNAGSSIFAAQFNHGDGTHNPSSDTYSATAVSDAAHGSASGVSSGAF
jgi:hypothetical protein